MKKISFLLILILNVTLSYAQSPAALIPYPNNVVIKEDVIYPIDEVTAISYSGPDLLNSAKDLQQIIRHKTGITVPIKENGKGNISMSVDKNLNTDEHYVLEVGENQITLKGATPEAVFRGVTTLGQLLLSDNNLNKIEGFKGVTIDDEPRFSYRALMLDPARHFLTVDEIKFFIDQMAKYKFNVLQLHLTDDQGWRIKLDNYPQLSSEQAYSKEDIQDLINYAADKYIEIVPEIDIPGHTSAFLAVYPELGCKNKQGEEIIVGKTDNRMLCASNEEVYDIFGNIIAEVTSMFPSSYIHLGGDEAAIKYNWAQCESCLALMNELGYTDPSRLMIPFFDKMLGFVRENGKKPILWCELNNIYPPADDFLFPYPEDVTFVTWRNGLTPTCIELTGKRNSPLIMAPGEYAYLDYPQFKGDLPEYNNWGMPVSPLSRTYQLDPGYGLPQEEQQHIMGVMGTLWGEAINDINRATYMAFPRALALSEAGWTQMDNRDWESFKQRMYPNLYELMKDGVSFRVPFEIVER